MGIRVVLADDPVVREGLRALLEAAGGFEVVEFVGTAAEAVRSATITRPDVLVLDTGLPDASGVEAAQLNLSPHTVDNHVTSIFAKLGVATRSEAIVRAREAGLGG